MVLHRIANPSPSGLAGSIPARGVYLPLNINSYKEYIYSKIMNISGLLKKIFNVKEDYIEVIPGNNFPYEDKENLNRFIEQVKLNRGQIKNINAINCSNQEGSYDTEYDGEFHKKNPYSTGYVDKFESWTKLSHHFIIHYKCSQKLEHEKEGKT